MRPSFKPPRAIRAIQMQAALAEALEHTQHAHTRATPKPPAGMKPLITPHEALSLRQPSGDATLLRIAFARYLFWRALLGERRPTTASVEACARRLLALACWHYAVTAHAQGLPLPLRKGKSAREVPAFAVSAAHLPAKKPKRTSTGTSRTGSAETSITRAGGSGSGNGNDQPPNEPIPGRTDESYDFGDYLTDYLDINADDPLSTLDTTPGNDAAGDVLDAEGVDALDFWENWGDLADLPVDSVVDPSKLGINQSDYAVAGDVLTFAPLLDLFASSGLSDLQIAQMIDWAAAGQTATWAGQTLYGDAGIAGTFDIRDPYFYDFLREQSGWLINPAGVGVIDSLRADMAETMWSLMGGDVGPGISVTALARELASQYGPDLAEGTRYSADYRAYMIAVTETARAESFGEFVSMWTLGAKQKIWIVNAGACLICVGNEEEGAIPITQSFSGGFQGPPQHPLCFPAGTVVGGPKALASTERWYAGSLVEVLTVGGHFLTCTPNHPVLTPKGWIAAGQLHEGDDVVCGGFARNGLGVNGPHNDQIPARIEDVAHALARAVGASTEQVMVTPEDFHGDGLDGEVCIVWSDRQLLHDLKSTSPKHLRQDHLIWSDVLEVGLAALGNVQQFLARPFPAARPFVSTSNHVATLFRRPFGLDDVVGFCDSAQSHSSPLEVSPYCDGGRARNVRNLLERPTTFVQGDELLQVLWCPFPTRSRMSHRSATRAHDAVDRWDADAIPSREALERFSRNITTDKVVGVNLRKFAGHVYNLQTADGWYLASTIPSEGGSSDTFSPDGTGIVVHNCRCSAAPAVPDTFDPEQWMSRTPSDLDPLLFNWAGTQWPNVDLGELADLDASDFQMAQTPDETRTARKPHREQPTAQLLRAYDVATQMLAVTEAVAEGWAREAHVRYPPQSERELYGLAQRLRKSQDELPDAREATEHYIVALRAGLRDVLRESVTTAKAG